MVENKILFKTLNNIVLNSTIYNIFKTSQRIRKPCILVGVLHGSVHVPILFFIYIHDLLKLHIEQFVFFSDNTEMCWGYIYGSRYWWFENKLPNIEKTVSIPLTTLNDTS